MAGRHRASPPAFPLIRLALPREAYNPATDDVEERTFTTPARTFLVFSIGVNSTDGDGEPFTNWIRCVAWHSLAESYQTGDRVRVTGFFKIRNYIQEGEAKSIREFVVVEIRLERKKVQEEGQTAA